MKEQPVLFAHTDSKIKVISHINHTLFKKECEKSQQLTFSIGIDEVGRGPLYGSVVVAAVILPSRLSGEYSTGIEDQLSDTPLSVLTDSKKLSDKKRQALLEPIQSEALAYSIVDVPAGVIDDINIFHATMLGMKEACQTLMISVKEMVKDNHLSVSSVQFECLFDGNKTPSFDWKRLQEHGVFENEIKSEAWVKGDSRHTAIAAASVLAKVKRDNDLTNDAKQHPEYGLEQHKGYPTKAHLDVIAQYGVLPKHRKSFRPVAQVITDIQNKS